MHPDSPRLILTRPHPENDPWLAALTGWGGRAVAWPLIDIEPAPLEPDLLGPLWPTLSEFQAVMFVSRSAVQHFFARRPPGVAWPSPTRAWCTGPGTRRSLVEQGLEISSIDAPPSGSTWDTEHLWPVVASQVAPGHRFLFVRGTDGSATHVRGPDPASPPSSPDAGVGRDWLAQQVLRSGGQITWAVSYVRAQPRWDDRQTALARSAANDGSVWVFSSSQAVQHLQRLMPDQDWRGARAVATHARIAQKARDLGFGHVLTSQPDPEQVWGSLKSLP